jgi:isopentenyldiphosphate isomerase
LTSPADELIDVIDDAGRTIRVATRREVRQQRLPHRCVYLLVFDSAGRLFIHQRTTTKDVYPGYWDVAVGGVLAAGEAFDSGARREAQEELGVAVDLVPLFPFHYSDEATVVQAMAYRAVHDGPFRLQPEEVVCGEFVPISELHERLASRPFCPDGLAVLARFKQLSGGQTSSASSG